MTGDRAFKIGCFVAVATAVVVPSAYGWPGICHILITEDAGYPELRFYANLPDTYPSTQAWWKGGLPSNYFGWTHIRLTVSDWPGWGTPVEGVEDPAYDMWVPTTKKLRDLSPTEEQECRRTALGWRAHMAADRVVHFSYFPGGTLANWISHAVMEAEAGVLTYVDRICDRDLERAFNIDLDDQGNWVSGDGSVREGYEPEWLGNWRLVSLAQRVYLKNQRKTAETEDKTIWPETSQVVSERAAERLAEFEGTVSQWNFKGYLPYPFNGNEFDEAVSDYAQLLTQNAPAGTKTLHVKFMYFWEVGEQVQVYEADGSQPETHTIAAIDRVNRTVTLEQTLANAYSGDGTGSSDYVMYMPDSNWEPYEPRWEASVQAVQQQVAGLQGQ